MISHVLALFLVFGVFFVPVQANAGLLSMFGLGEKASAEDVLPATNLNNSQNMELLTPSFSPVLANQDKKKEENTVKEDASVTIASENALVPVTSSMGANPSEDTEAEISVYVVRKGDSLAAIAEMFDVSANTILWANDMKKGDKLVEGDTLIILPISGIEHTVTKGQTLKGIALKYKADIADIASFNGISETAALTVGDKLIIPDGQLIDSTPASSPSTKKPTVYVDVNIGSTDAYFIKPIPCPLTQGKHDHYAVDMSCHESGTPIKAAASGTVIFSKNGYNGGFGNLIIIKHPNGTQTFYAHQSQRVAHQGDQVSQGEVIGYVGSTGRSTGPHLHFEVRGAKNPGFDSTGKSWKKQ
ncbi:MAG: M23 family metallopeptidase [Patescibacteria group bacterium]